MSQELKPCPACESRAALSRDGAHVACSNSDCVLLGPSMDLDGKKWNALPRRGDLNVGPPREVPVPFEVPMPPPPAPQIRLRILNVTSPDNSDIAWAIDGLGRVWWCQLGIGRTDASAKWELAKHPFLQFDDPDAAT